MLGRSYGGSQRVPLLSCTRPRSSDARRRPLPSTPASSSSARASIEAGLRASASSSRSSACSRAGPCRRSTRDESPAKGPRRRDRRTPAARAQCTGSRPTMAMRFSSVHEQETSPEIPSGRSSVVRTEASQRPLGEQVGRLETLLFLGPVLDRPGIRITQGARYGLSLLGSLLPLPGGGLRAQGSPGESQRRCPGHPKGQP